MGTKKATRPINNRHAAHIEGERKRQAGLYQKFKVQRYDGRDGPGEKHYRCQYFVLDATHDPHAIPALRAYALSCRHEYPRLADELQAMADKVERSQRLQAKD